MRDITLEDTFYIDFTTRAFATGIPTVLAGSPVLSVLEENNATPITAGVSVAVDRASVVGLNMATIVATAANGYENGKGYSVYISTGTVGGVSAVGEVVGQFTIGVLATPTNITAGTITTATNLTNAPTSGDLTATMKTSVTTAATSSTPTINAASIVASISGNVDGNVTGTIGGAVATALDAILKSSTFALAIADAIWDEVLSGATHNVANSSGKRLRQLEAAFVVASGTAQAGAAGTITLAAGESSVTDIFAGDRCVIIGGTGLGEHGIITGYNGTTKVATMSQNWVITPDATSEYELTPADVDVETWQHVVVSNSATTNLPEVDAKSISDNAAAADSVQANIGNLDAAVSAIPTTAMRGTDSAATAASLATAQLDLDKITGSDGATLATAQANYAPAKAADILTTALTESYAADGVAPTLSQLLFLVQQTLTEFAITGTTITIKKIDGTTTAATITLDDGTNPTSATRAT